MKKNEIFSPGGKGITPLGKIFKMMKAFTLIMLVGVVHVSATTYSQNARLNLNMKGVSIKAVLSQIEEQTEYRFLYSDSKVNVEDKVDVNFNDKTVEDVLADIFEGTEIQFKMIDGQILLSPKGDMQIATQQQRVVNGKVTDSSGAPLPGVTVVVKGTISGTISDFDGNYSIGNVPADATLVFSFVGMKSQEIPVAGKTNINVILAEDAIGIEEVVAIGYGTQKKANLTGAVGVATAERLENRPIVNAGQGLQGVIPELNVNIRNGDPTTSAEFNIRGFESINGGSPLILVDGVPMDLGMINPNDISSVVVLKDAAAAAVYGARAAFGVILVETKEGKTGKIGVTLSTEQSFAKPIFLIDAVTDPYDHMVQLNAAVFRLNGNTPRDADYLEGAQKWNEKPTEENAWKVVNGTLRYYGNSDYRNKLLTDFAPQQKYDLNISGATEKASFYVSFGYINKDGYLRINNENFKRYNVLMKTDFKINNWLSLDNKIVFNSQYNDKPHFYGADANINVFARAQPYDPLQFPDLPYYVTPGDHDQYAQYIGMYFGGTNFLPYLVNGGRTTFTKNDLWLTQGITLAPLKGLKIRGDFSYNFFFEDYQDVASKVDIVSQNLLTSPLISHGRSANDFINNITYYNQYYVFNTYAEYTLTQFHGHYLKAMVGFNQEWGRNKAIGAMASSLLTPGITDLDATTGDQQTSGGRSQVSLRGAFYRLNYIYKDKYLFEANGRYDGTSRFPKDSRFGFFPSISAGWRISNEPFMDRTRGWLDNLKLRASYGTLGNQLLGNNYYPYISTMAAGTSNYMMSASSLTPYVGAASLVSNSLTWETVTTQNLGLDFTVLNQRLNVSFDAYIRDTEDMLMKVEYPAILGTSSPDANAADLRTKGWGLSVSWNDKIDQDWRYGVNLSLSDNQSEITKYENPTGAISDYYVGQKIGEIWGFETVGIFQYDEDVAAAPSQAAIGTNWRAGDMQYADLNDDKKITVGSSTLADPGDRKIIGNSSARYSFGINPDVGYKNWTLNIFFQGLFRDYLPSNASNNAFYPYNSSLIEKWYIKDSWSEDNRDAYFAAPMYSTGNKKNILPQSRFVQNAAYIRLKNLTLSYNIPQILVNKIGLSKGQVYFAGQNLWEYTKMRKPLDPESVFTVAQEYYQQRIFTLGVKLTF